MNTNESNAGKLGLDLIELSKKFYFIYKSFIEDKNSENYSYRTLLIRLIINFNQIVWYHYYLPEEELNDFYQVGNTILYYKLKKQNY